jgi:transcriptional regulator with GAF, ATPase, and Fis domain
MRNGLKRLSDQQWKFLAVLDTLGAPVPINLACGLAPISPSELIDLTDHAMSAGWLQKQEPDSFLLAPKLPESVRKRIQRLTTAPLISSLLEKMKEQDFSPDASSGLRANLLARSGRLKEAAFVEHEIGLRALKGGDPETSLEFFNRAVDKLFLFLGKPECDSLFVSAALELSHLRFRSGKRVGEIMGLLEKAKDAASRLGDRRSLTLIKLHMGRHFMRDDRPDALQLLASGLDEVNELGDKDIHAQAQEFSGLYYYLHGRFREAVENFEVALQRAELHSERPRHFQVPQWLGFSAAYLGQVEHAVGLLKFQWQSACKASEWALADNFRATLGIVLLVTGHRQEARVHLQGAFQSAVANQNHVGQFHSQLALAYCDLMDGRPADAYGAALRAFRQGTETGALLRQYTWPWILEMLYEFHCQGCEPVPGFEYHRESERGLSASNAHLRGVALRLRARDLAQRGGDPAMIWADLVASEEEQKSSGSLMELAKTWLEMARLKLHLKDPESAAELAQRAWEKLSGFSEDLFPQELKTLLEPRKPNPPRKSLPDSRQELIGRFVDIMEEIVPGADLDQFLHRVLTATGRFFQAKRGGIFWFQPQNGNQRPLLRSAYNLTKEEAAGPGFQAGLKLVQRAYRARQPQVSFGPEGRKETSCFCIPFKIQDQACGVVYLDHSLIEEGLDSGEKPMLERMARQLGSHIERIWDYCKLLEEKALFASKTPFMDSSPDKWEIRSSSPVMGQMLDRVDRVANSEATVMILGETGVGKELLARRLHQKNGRRRTEPFIVVDITSIPKDLLESELFGHEKGAFTGADRRKPGLLEMAHDGTLFIDEVADTPLGMQVKLLRALQEKSFYRVGGTQPISSDFRLVCATNRNIEEAVAGGAFREDLFYRLNVIQLVVPPLRNRGTDIPLLARAFLDEYVKKYQRPGLALTAEDEALLSKYSWPGNVRELRNVIERAVLLSSGGKLEFTLPCGVETTLNDPFADGPTLDEIQRRYIRRVLEKTNGRIGGPAGASRILGMKRTTLYTRMKALGIKRG